MNYQILCDAIRSSKIPRAGLLGSKEVSLGGVSSVMSSHITLASHSQNQNFDQR